MAVDKEKKKLSTSKQTSNLRLDLVEDFTHGHYRKKYIF